MNDNRERDGFRFLIALKAHRADRTIQTRNMNVLGLWCTCKLTWRAQQNHMIYTYNYKYKYTFILIILLLIIITVIAS